MTTRAFCGSLLPVVLIADTHRLISTLVERGFSDDQAEAIVDAIQDIDLSAIASKADMLALDSRIDSLDHKLEKAELRLTIRLGGLISSGIAILAVMKFFA